MSTDEYLSAFVVQKALLESLNEDQKLMLFMALRRAFQDGKAEGVGIERSRALQIVYPSP